MRFTLEPGLARGYWVVDTHLTARGVEALADGRTDAAKVLSMYSCRWFAREAEATAYQAKRNAV